MTDGIHERTADDYHAFGVFAFKMLKSGICAKIMCADHLHYDGPQYSNDRCWQCMGNRVEGTRYKVHGAE